MSEVNTNALQGLAALANATNKVEKGIVEAQPEPQPAPQPEPIVAQPQPEPLVAQQPAVEERPVETQAKRTSFFLRTGTDLRVPITVPNFGEFTIVFENATTQLGEKLTEALRAELKRNITLAQNVFEYDADDATVQSIVAHHQKVAMQRKGGSSGLDSTQNNHLATEFRDPSLYNNQPKGRHADELLRGKQAALGT